MLGKSGLADSETTFKVHNLTREFILYCRSQNELVSQKIGQIVVRILLLNSKWSSVLNKNAAKGEKQQFLKECCSFLFGEKCISGLTIRMQCFFYGKYLNRDSYKDHHRQIMLRNCFHLLQKLKTVWHNPTEDFREMHNDLVKLVLIKEGMDGKDDNLAFDEMKTAVSSIFPPSALSTFVMSNQKSKMAFINEVSSIAAGIRLHAWHLQKAGKLMFDVCQIMKETLPKVLEDLHDEISEIGESLETIRDELKIKEPHEISDDNEIYNKKLVLIHLTNYFVFLKALKTNIDEVAVQTYKLDYAFAINLEELGSSLKTGPFTQAERIYPLYKELAKTWKHLQLEGHLLTFYSNLFFDLKKHFKGGNKMKPEEINISKEIEVNESESDEMPITIFPESVKNFNDITIEYKDFCAFYCSMGILVPCDRNLGIIMYKNLCYGFSSQEAMNHFQSQPSQYLSAAERCILTIPQLIFTLQMEKHFNLPVMNTIKTKDTVMPVFISDRSVQTVLHPTEEHIDYTYNWNQWTLRKQALKYVDISNKRTHSTQTNNSHFRRENFSQVYLPKDNCTQTGKDASTSTAFDELKAKIF